MVMTALDRRWERLLKRIEELRTWRNAHELPIEQWAIQVRVDSKRRSRSAISGRSSSFRYN